MTQGIFRRTLIFTVATAGTATSGMGCHDASPIRTASERRVATRAALVPHDPMWRGVELRPDKRTPGPAELPELFIQEPPGSATYAWRKDIVVVEAPAANEPIAYYVPTQDHFYVRDGSPGASTITLFGPYPGDPRKVLRPPLSRPPPTLPAMPTTQPAR